MTQHNRPLVLGFIAALAVGALALGGCSAASDPGSEDDAVSFSFAYPTSNNLESPYETLAQAYMNAHPEVTITLNPQPSDSYAQNLRTQLQAGNSSDVVQVTPGRGSGQGALLLAEADFLEPLDETAKAVIPQGNADLFEIDGVAYAQPLDFTVQGLVVNASAVDATITTFPGDATDLLEACSAAADDGTSFMAAAGAAANQTALLAVTIAASRVYADAPDWNEQRTTGEVAFASTPGWLETLELIQDMQDSGCFQPGVEGSGFDAITNGLSAGSVLSSAIPGGAATELARAAEEQHFVIQPFPADSAADAWVYGSSNYALAITSASEQKEAAEAFLDWVAEPEQAALFAETSGALPVNGFEELDLSDTIYAPVADLLAAGSFGSQPNNLWPNQEVYQALGTGVQALLTGQQEPDEVLAAMDAAWGE